MKLPTVRCESCGDERELNLLSGPSPRCENCESRALTQGHGGSP